MNQGIVLAAATDIASLPIIGEYSIIGFLLSIIIAFVTAVLTGRLVPKSSLDRERQTTDTFKTAWETETKKTEQQTLMLNRLGVVGESMDKLIKALPPVHEDREEN